MKSPTSTYFSLGVTEEPSRPGAGGNRFTRLAKLSDASSSFQVDTVLYYTIIKTILQNIILHYTILYDTICISSLNVAALLLDPAYGRKTPQKQKDPTC